jgi:uracil-DNA glycosylase
MGEGPTPCALMFVGEAPGAEEEKQGRPFVGPSGEELEAALNEAGIAREDVYITNAYKLRPPGNRNPTDEELYDHSQELWCEIADVQPALIVTLGNVPLGAITGERGGITRRRGRPVTVAGGWTVFPAYHPAYVLRNLGTQVEQDFYNDIKTAVDYALKQEK